MHILLALIISFAIIGYLFWQPTPTPQHQGQNHQVKGNFQPKSESDFQHAVLEGIEYRNRRQKIVDADKARELFFENARKEEYLPPVEKPTTPVKKLTVSGNLLGPYTKSRRKLPNGWPLQRGRVSSVYGPRWGRAHKGVDIAAPTGTPVYAVESGVVKYSKKAGNFGNLIEIRHGATYITRYAHNSKNLVKVGQKVKKGQKIALVGSTGGSTGPHVHFEVLEKQGKFHAINPIMYLGLIGKFNLKSNTRISKTIKITD